MGAGDHPMNHGMDVGMDVLTSTEPWATEYVEKITINYNKGNLPPLMTGGHVGQVSDQ